MFLVTTTNGDKYKISADRFDFDVAPHSHRVYPPPMVTTVKPTSEAVAVFATTTFVSAVKEA